jgi:DNA repair protein RadC
VIKLPEKSTGSTQQSLFNVPGSSLNHSKFIAADRVMLVRDQHLPFEQSTLSDSHQAQSIIRKLIKTYGQSDREQFCVMLLNTKNVFIGLNIVSTGAVSYAHVSPREVLKPAILANAAAMILSHNLCEAQHKLCGERIIPSENKVYILPSPNRSLEIDFKNCSEL